MLAVHDSYAASSPLVTRISSLGYSGEHFDAKAQQQYLRARFYNPANGRFNRLDPFAGNMQDPQSLHKYVYVHGDPVGKMDPTGLFSLGGLGMTMSIGATLGGIGGAGFAYSAGGNANDIAFAGAIGVALGVLATVNPLLAFRLFGSILIDLHASIYQTIKNQKIVAVPGGKANEGRLYRNLASLAYSDDIATLPAGWVVADQITHDDAPNYRARVFTDGNEVVLAFAGTNDFPDVITDAFQGVFGGGRDYEYAIKDAKKLIDANPGASIRFVGHSLGGGLATAAAAVHGNRATTFNAAGVNQRTLTPHNASLIGIDNRVDAFRVQGEFLSTFQDSDSFVGMLMPNSNGKPYYIRGEGNTFIKHTSKVLFDALSNI